MNTINQTKKVISLEIYPKTLRAKFDIPEKFTMDSFDIREIVSEDIYRNQYVDNRILVFVFSRSQVEHEGAHAINVSETIRKEVPINEFMELFNVPLEYELDDWKLSINYILTLKFQLSY